MNRRRRAAGARGGVHGPGQLQPPGGCLRQVAAQRCVVRPCTSDRALAHVAHKLRTTHGVHKAARVPVFLTRTNQFDNTANRDAHYASTGPEIWEQLNGRVDGFTCSTGACVRALPLPMRPPPARRPHLRLTRACTLGAWARGPGTGGTLAGTARYLKERNPAVKVFLADPPGSVLYRYFKSGRKELERTGTGSITEGDCLAAALLRRRPSPLLLHRADVRHSCDFPTDQGSARAASPTT